MSDTAEAVLFDYGGVLTGPVRPSIESWLTREHLDAAVLWEVLGSWVSASTGESTPVHRLETGELELGEFDRLLAARLRRRDGSRPSADGLTAAMLAELRPDTAMFELVGDLREAGIRVGMLSNSWAGTYPRDLIDALLDPIVISAEVGLRKPDPAIFELAVDRLGMRPDQVLFVDDSMDNVAGARRAGLRALLHTDPHGTRIAMAALLERPSPQNTPQRRTP
ncbi:HAD family phosphatase [Nocardia sp. NPDC050710]|uniref:HAD family hydrolase n=1 Tax=Nocardia sp. NPDC050710 TaxID=3157220 RepID=UPI0033D55740